jgi:DNA-binding NtrC family response regulator
MKMKILVVEDEAAIREVVTMILGQYGHEVIEARNADEAISILGSNDVDIVITDNDMPKRHEGMRVIQFAHTLPSRPFIVWTSGYASGDPALCQKALDTGADRVLFKPFRMDELNSIVARAAARRMLEVVPM